MTSANNPTRVTAGFLDASQDGAFGNYRQLRPVAYAKDFDDFFDYFAAQWIKTDTGTGTITVGSGATGINGRLLVANAAAGATDALSIQWCGHNAAVALPWTFDSTKDLVVATTVQFSDPVNAGSMIGLAATDTTPEASLPANGVFFNVTAGGDLNLVLAKASVNTLVQLVPAASLVAATDYALVAFYTASDQTWRAFVNNVPKMPSTGWPTSSAGPTVALTKTMGILNTNSAANSMSADYLFVAQRRGTD